MPRVVVVGGGISGLACGWTIQREARRAGTGVEVLVLERGAEVGGKARSIARDGWLVEAGPSGFLGGRTEMDRLVDEAGLRDELVPADAAARRRFVYQRGRVREIVAHPVGLVRAGILSPLAAARLLLEPLVPRGGGEDESVFDFAARRAGRQFAERLVRPMALGIFAGDARRLSLEAALPLMAALEREHGSLIRAMIARRRAGVGARELASFRGGMQQLPRALAARGGFEVRRSTMVRGLVRLPDDAWGVVVEGSPEPIVADAVVLAGEPWAMAALLEPHAAVAAAELHAIACPPVSVVALGYAPEVAARVEPGFGVLVSRGEEIHALGALRESHLYPRRAPSGHLLLRAIYGGAVDREMGRLGEADLLALARSEVGRLHGIREAPVFSHVVRVPRAIPQYEVGHRARVGRIERAVGALPQLWLTGFGLRGVAFADAASEGVRTGEAVARWARSASPAVV